MSCSFFTCTGDYCETTRNVDQMMEKFKSNRDKVIDMLKENPESLNLWKKGSILSNDQNCLMRMGKSIGHSLKNYYICPQCVNVSRLTELTQTPQKMPTPANTPFMMECGKRTGEYLVYTEQKVIHPYIKSVKSTKGERNLVSDIPNLNNLKRFEADPFTSGIMVQWCLENAGVPHIRPLHMAWICGEHGYRLTDHAIIGNISQFQKFHKYLDHSASTLPTAMANDKCSLNSETVLGIVTQLAWATLKMSEFGAGHHQPSTTALQFTNKSVSYMADKVHITSPVTLWIDQWSGSGITCGQSRIYSNCPIAKLELSRRQPFNPIDMFKTQDGNLVYRLKRNVKTPYLFWHLQGLGFPVYCSSFNLYAFLVVLLCEKAFYLTFMKTMKNWWKRFWVIGEDMQTVERRLQDYHDNGPVSREQVLDILTGVHLKCNMIDEAWNFL